ncbi:MAG: hypothetical protein J6S96_09080 [Muribaculaceae bacterium]|nr:hypothetical protein [Muribaculaceae bacterium]
MKKVLFLLVAFALIIGFTCCANTGENAAAGEDQAKTENVEKKVDINELVAKAKAEGANWSVDEWKAAFKDLLIAAKPMLDFMKDFKEKLEKDPAAAATMMEGLEKNNDLESIGKAFEEFSNAAEATANGKAVLDDEDWGKQQLKELGYPEDVLK